MRTGRFGEGAALLIDRGNIPWILGTAAAGLAAASLHAWLDARTPGELTGGTVAGLWFGVAGLGLMVYAGLLAVLRKVPAWWWLGSRAAWLKGHIWLGLLSGFFVLLHADYSLGGPLEATLWVLVVLTLGTGILGLALQQALPRLLTARVANEAPFEQIPRICQVMTTRADEIIASITAADAPLVERFHEELLRDYLAPGGGRPPSPLADPIQAEAVFAGLRRRLGRTARDELDQLEGLCRERRQLAEQERLHVLLHAWLYLHVPVSVALLVLAAVHAVASLYY